MKEIIDKAWTADFISDDDKNTIQNVINNLDQGLLKVCEKIHNQWIINAWLKKAILLYFKITSNVTMQGSFFDKIPLKFDLWKLDDFIQAKLRVVPGAVVRYGANIGSNSVIMPSFINIGANIGCHSMIDSNATIGSCASIGNRVHISANALIGGVLEPLSDTPVIIEDDVFIGAASSITSGILVSEGAVIASGLHISPSTRIYDSINNTISYGIIPPKAVVIPGTVQKTPYFSLNAAIIVKYRDSITDSKVALNDLLHVI